MNVEVPQQWRVPLALRALAELVDAGRAMTTADLAAELAADEKALHPELVRQLNRGYVERWRRTDNAGRTVPGSVRWGVTELGRDVCAAALGGYADFIAGDSGAI